MGETVVKARDTGNSKKSGRINGLALDTGAVYQGFIQRAAFTNV
jgi:hypothetical protein